MNYYRNDIRHNKGDTYSSGLVIEGLGQTVDSIYFTCRENLNDNAEILFQSGINDGISLVEYDEENDIRKYAVRIAPSKTRNLQSGTYYYDLEVNVNSDVFTVMKGKFIIEQDATREDNEQEDETIILIKSALDEINGEVISVDVSEKLLYLKNTKELIKTGINNLGGELTNENTFRSYTDALDIIYEEYPKVSDSGTSINLTNTKKGKITTELNPSETSQESTTGKNLLPYTANDINETINSTKITGIKGIYTIQTTPTATVYQTYVSLVKPYTIQSGDYLHIMNDVASSNVTFNLKATDDTVLSPTLSSVNRIFDLSSHVGKTINSIRFYVSTSYDGTKIKLSPMIINSSIATSYEPYTGGPAPNPSYPFPIHTVSGENNIKIENKNLINFGTQSFTTFYQQTDLNIPAGTYTLSALITSSDTTNTYSRAYFYSASGTSLGVVNLDRNTRASKTITLTDIATRLVIYSSIDYSSSNGKTATWKDIMLEQGSAATEYTPHQEQNYVIHLGDLEYCKIGDYKDQIFKNTINSPYYDSTLNENEWYMKKNIGKVVLDGSETYVNKNLTETNFLFQTTISTLKNNSDVLSNYFKEIKDLWDNDTEGILSYNNILRMRINKNLLNDISSQQNAINSFKAWLTTHNTEVYYVLNTPQYINITENYPTLATQLENLSKAKSYDDETNISQTNNDLQFIINASALMKGDE